MERAPVTVLVVDDNAANRALAVATLEDEREEFRVITATGGEEAVELSRRALPDCIVMDVRMPKMDGIAACELIRALPGGNDIAIIFVTAQRDLETFDRALAAGGDDFLTKPVRPDELVLRVQTALRFRRIASQRSELSEELKQQRDRLQRIELQKEQLVAFLVHDLKNPVHSVDLQAQTILRARELGLAHRAAARIREDAVDLMRMIMNLLDISKADEGRLMPALQAIDAAEIVRDVADELRIRAAATSVRIDVEAEVASCELWADPDILSRVLANLLDNAIRHAPEGSDVRISAIRMSQGIEFRIMDSGPGVPVGERERVFERFRSDTSTATRTNRGLGLAFCKVAVEAHGGRIWIEDASPGAVFCVRLAAGKSN